MDYEFLKFLALILLSTKLFGLVTRKIKLPQVVGALLAGVFLGPACLGLIEKTDFISSLSELGVILLMFTAGLDTDINEMKKNSVACLAIASIGVIVPLVGGTACYYFFFTPGTASYDDILKAVRYFLCFFKLPVCHYSEYDHNDHHYEDTGMRCGNPDLLTEYLYRKNTMDHKVDIVCVTFQ